MSGEYHAHDWVVHDEGFDSRGAWWYVRCQICGASLITRTPGRKMRKPVEGEPPAAIPLRSCLTCAAYFEGQADDPGGPCVDCHPRQRSAWRPRY